MHFDQNYIFKEVKHKKRNQFSFKIYDSQIFLILYNNSFYCTSLAFQKIVQIQYYLCISVTKQNCL